MEKLLMLTMMVIMELVRFHIVDLSPRSVLHVLRLNFQARIPHTNLPPKVLTSLRKFLGPLTLKFSHAARQTMRPRCSNHNNSFSCSPKSVTSTLLCSHSRINLMMQSAVVLMLIIVLTDFKTKLISTPQSHGHAYIAPPPMSPGTPLLF